MASASFIEIISHFAGYLQIFEDIARSSGGDVQAINQVLARAQADPASLAVSLSPSTLARLHALAEKLSAPSGR